MTPDLLIDADMYLFQAASACEVERDWGDDHWTLHSDAKEVHKVFRAHLQRFQDEIGQELGSPVGEPILCFSDPSRRSFRHDLTPTYKQARKKTRKPLAYAAVRDQLRDSGEFKVIIKPQLEGDDVMGIVSTRAPGKFIIVSGDKDMQSIPGNLYRDDKLREVSKTDADLYHLTQTLTGDVTDGYSGCPGVGEVKARNILGEAILKGWGRVWPEVVKAFTKAGLTADDALLQARLARILRASDWDFTKSEPILWTPGT